jgi:uncharacterized protein DUF6114
VSSPVSGETPAGFDPAGVPASSESGQQDLPRPESAADRPTALEQQGAAPVQGAWWEGAMSGPAAQGNAVETTAALESSHGPDGLPEAGASDGPSAHGSLPHRARIAFRHWRRTRPFWGGLLITAGGVEILFTEKAPLGVVLHVGTQGLAGYLLPAMMILCGLLLWFAPAQRTFYSVLSVLLSLGTWLTSNLGGFLIGMLLGVVGGSLAFGWTSRTGARAAKQRKERSKKKADPARV